MALPNNKKDDQPKRQSLMGFLFNPEIGASIRPLGESVGMFVRLIAMVFASARLFPADHPALRGGDRRATLTLAEVFRTAWGNLSFTREGMPVVLFFLAVVASIVLSILFMVMAALSFFSTKAHAATGMFVAPGGAGACPSIGSCDASKDIAINWINFLFMKTPLPSLTIDNPGGKAMALDTPQSMGIQDALYAALGFYSNGILVIASFLLLYHLLSMVAETAHHGVAMGKRASQIWAPLRLVFALGLLVPISTGVGLNTGQYLVVQVAKWGSGLASQVWSLTVDSLAKNATFQFRTPNVPYGVDDAVANLIRIRACKMAFNAAIHAPSYMTPYDDTYLVKDLSGKKEIKDASCSDLEYQTGLPSGGDCTLAIPGTRHSYGNEYAPELCGFYDVSPPALDKVASPQVRGMQDALYNAHKSAIDLIMRDDGPADAAASKVLAYVSGLTPAEMASFAPGGIVGSIEPVDVVNIYKLKLQSEFTAAGAAWAGSLNDLTTRWADQGWVTAGAWFNTIARAQGNIINASEAPMPAVSPPLGTSVDGRDRGVRGFVGLEPNVNSVFAVVQKAMAKFNENSMSRMSLSDPTSPDLNGPGKGYVPPTETAAAGTDPASTGGKGKMDVRAFMWVVDHLGQGLGVWGQGDGLQITFGKTANPLAELAFLGFTHVEFGMQLIGWGLIAQVSSGLLGFIPVVGSALAAGAGALGGLAVTIGCFFLMIGFTMAFVLPLLPFIKFFFNVLTWVLSLFEAIVSMPLLALAHVTPYGDGLPGDMARGGYYMILSVFLRPVLMVFGLIAGLLLFFVAIAFLNSTFAIATAGTGYAGSSLAVLGKIVYSVMYCVFAYICANTCFKAISYFPEHGMNWLGKSGVAGRQMGDTGAMSAAMGATAGYLGERGISSMAKGVGGVGSGVKGALEKVKGDAAQLQRDQVSERIANAVEGRGGNAANNPDTGSGGDVRIAAAGAEARQSAGISGGGGGAAGGSPSRAPSEVGRDPMTNLPKS